MITFCLFAEPKRNNMNEPLKHKYVATYKEGLNTTARFELIASGNRDAKAQCREIKKEQGIRGSLKLKFIEKL